MVGFARYAVDPSFTVLPRTVNRKKAPVQIRPETEAKQTEAKQDGKSHAHKPSSKIIDGLPRAPDGTTAPPALILKGVLERPFQSLEEGL